MPVDINQLEDFRRIANADPEILRGIVDRLAGLDPEPISPGRLYAKAREGLADERVADSFIRQALFTFWPIRRGWLTVEELLQNIRDALSDTPNWNDQEQRKWSGIESAFGSLLSLDVVRLVAAGIDLSYEHVNVFKTARVLTDIRPIFTNDATRIEGAVVSHALHIQFQSLDGPHELAIALDESDVEELLEICQRALTKTKTAQSLMRDVGNMPMMIPGRPDDA
jgi:hypothetical protein